MTVVGPADTLGLYVLLSRLGLLRELARRWS